MWIDKETDRDFLNFSGVAERVADVIVRSAGEPVTIGISGAWGVGKTSMMKLIRKSLEGQKPEGEYATRFVFVEFNAWLYQGYDDARAALMDVIAQALIAEVKQAGHKGNVIKRARSLLGRVRWFRLATSAAPAVLTLASGGFSVPASALGQLAQVVWGDGETVTTTADNAAAAANKSSKNQNGSSSFLEPQFSPPEQISEIRTYFDETIQALGITLVVLIDDLDRCLPQTAISTLEAIRLFLFLKNAAFVIAADEVMIKQAVMKHLGGVGDEQATNYFDKLIQVPVRVPQLGVQEVRAYLLLLFIENGNLAQENRDTLYDAICKRLSETWRGDRVDQDFVGELTKHMSLPLQLKAQIDMTDRVAVMLASADRISGNPRIIKRLLNTLSMRLDIAKSHGIPVDQAELVKMLIFERCASADAYRDLSRAVGESEDGRFARFAEWEKKRGRKRTTKRDPPWDSQFIEQWLAMPPPLAKSDLRGILYLSREHAPMFTSDGQLSAGGAELLAAILDHPKVTDKVLAQLRELPESDLGIMLNRILEQAQQESKWGAPPILDAAISIAEVCPGLGDRIAVFLRERPLQQVNASIVPKIARKDWAKPLLKHWLNADVTGPVKNAITQLGGNDGHF